MLARNEAYDATLKLLKSYDENRALPASETLC